MKNTRFLSVLGVVFMVAILLFSCDTGNGPGNGPGDGTPTWAEGFYNYPTGRVDSNAGRLTINNTIASEVLLFTDTVDKGNYIGTVGSLSSVRIRLPEEKFYSIVAVVKDNYIERRGQADQFNSLTYYSNLQPYTVSVSPSNTWGGGNWIFNNNTNYWVEVKKADLSQNHAVIAPGALRVTVPIRIGDIYDYLLFFKRELKYNGKVMALVDFEDRSQANTAQVNNTNPTFTTNISNSNAPSTNIKPAIMVINNATQTVRVYRANTQMTNGSPGGDFVVVGGQRELITGLENNDLTTAINFQAIAWGDPRYVPESQSMEMHTNKVYEITIPASGTASEITVREVDASEYFN